MAKFDVKSALMKLRSQGWEIINKDGKLHYRALRKGILIIPSEMKKELDSHRKEIEDYVLGDRKQMAKPPSEIDDWSPFDDPKVLFWSESKRNDDPVLSLLARNRSSTY